MQENYSTTSAPTSGADGGPGAPNAVWNDPGNITADDGNTSWLGISLGGQQGDPLVASGFSFGLPDEAVIDGIEVTIDGEQIGCTGTVNISFDDIFTVGKDAGALGQSFGGSTDLWGADAEITPADIEDMTVQVELGDISGGDGVADIDYMTVTVYWHIEASTPPADVPIRLAYKAYSRDGTFLGELPTPTNPFAFAQDKDSAGSSIEIVCPVKAENLTTVDALLTDDDVEILTDEDLPILAETTNVMIAEGRSNTNAIFKNSNRIAVIMYNYWYPNGKLMFSGQVNRVNFRYGGGDSTVRLLVFSDGYDMNGLIARGYPFNYTTDVSQTSQNGYVTVSGSAVSAGWQRYGQSWMSGASADNLGAVTLKLGGTANVTLSIYDRPNGNLLGSVTKSVAIGTSGDVTFEFGELLDISPNTSYFMAMSVPAGKSIRVYRHGTSATYANGAMYSAIYSGGSGGGTYSESSGDLYFITKYGTPTTTTTYSSDDPVTEMMSGILADYNARGGYITERDFEATGLSLTYTFNQSTIFDALKKILELSPTGYYAYVDLGTAELDIKQQSATADFTIVRGKDVTELDLALSIEEVKNYLLFTGGPAPTTNLYKDYKDSESASFYGLRTVPRTDNRVTTAATADAIGETFIEENSDESQQTSVTVSVTSIDHTLLVPGKTIGFRNFGNFIDDMVLQIVRREFNTKTVTLALGKLPVRLSDQIQRINRGLLNEQTINNPNAPS